MSEEEDGDPAMDGKKPYGITRSKSEATGRTVSESRTVSWGITESNGINSSKSFSRTVGYGISRTVSGAKEWPNESLRRGRKPDV